jgi:hypothetical protein
MVNGRSLLSEIFSLFGAQGFERETAADKADKFVPIVVTLTKFATINSFMR